MDQRAGVCAAAAPAQTDRCQLPRAAVVDAALVNVGAFQQPHARGEQRDGLSTGRQTAQP